MSPFFLTGRVRRDDTWVVARTIIASAQAAASSSPSYVDQGTSQVQIEDADQ